MNQNKEKCTRKSYTCRLTHLHTQKSIKKPKLEAYMQTYIRK